VYILSTDFPSASATCSQQGPIQLLVTPQSLSPRYLVFLPGPKDF